MAAWLSVKMAHFPGAGDVACVSSLPVGGSKLPSVLGIVE